VVSVGTTLTLASNDTATLVLVVHTTTLVSHYTSACLHFHVLGDWIIDITKLTITMGILAIVIPLTEAFVFKVATLLGLEALVD